MKYIVLTLVMTLFVSCLSSGDENITIVDYSAENELEIIEYIATNNLTAQKSDTGLYYVIDEPGTGAQPIITDNVTVAYKGYLTNGSVFDESDENGISFGLQEVIKGWSEGIPYFKEGGSGILLIPAHLGYGGISTETISAGSVLIFDVSLISVN